MASHTVRVPVRRADELNNPREDSLSLSRVRGINKWGQRSASASLIEIDPGRDHPAVYLSRPQAVDLIRALAYVAGIDVVTDVD